MASASWETLNHWDARALRQGADGLKMPHEVNSELSSLFRSWQAENAGPLSAACENRGIFGRTSGIIAAHDLDLGEPSILRRTLNWGLIDSECGGIGVTSCSLCRQAVMKTSTEPLCVLESSIPARTDRSLLEQCRKGNQDATRAIYRRYAGRLPPLVTSQCGAELQARLDPGD